MKAKARQLYPHDEQAKQANHLASCSCHMCGNPRKHTGKKPFRDLRADIEEASE